MTTILHIDDNEYNRDIMRRYLQKMGYKVIEAVDGYSGLELAIVNSPDLILLDINLPDIDGYAVLRQLKQHASTAHINVIAVTANAMNGDRIRCLNEGFDAYLPKPIVRTELTLTIRRFLPELAVSSV